MNFLLISMSLVLLIQNILAQVNNCWDPSTGTNIVCSSSANGYCSTDFTTGLGACSVDNSNSSLLYCTGSDDCNKFVTSCYNPANSTNKWGKSQYSPSGYVACDAAGANQYCQVNQVFFL